MAGDNDDEFHEELHFDNSDSSNDDNSMPHAVPYLGEVGDVSSIFGPTFGRVSPPHHSHSLLELEK